jgi:hypothetical protein
MMLLSLQRRALEQFLMLSQEEKLRLLQFLNDWHLAREELETAKLAYDDSEISVGEMVSREEEFTTIDETIKQLTQVSDVSILDALLRSRPEALRQN